MSVFEDDEIKTRSSSPVTYDLDYINNYIKSIIFYYPKLESNVTIISINIFEDYKMIILKYNNKYINYILYKNIMDITVRMTYNKYIEDDLYKLLIEVVKKIDE